MAREEARPPLSSAGSPHRVEKPWGYELHWAVTDRYCGKILHINQGESLSLQYHEVKDESLLLVNGLLELELDDAEGRLRTHRLYPGDSRRITPGRRHRMTALEESEIFEVSTPEIEDVVRLEDRYGRIPSSAPPAAHS